jgi:hypothetical protein
MNILSNRFLAIGRSITGRTFSRRQFIATSGYSIIGGGTFLGALSACSRSSEEEEEVAAEQPPEPVAEEEAAAPERPPSKLTRIKMGTMTAVELQPVEDRFKRWLGYTVVERGQITEALANSWGTPGMAGRDYILMQPEGGDDVFIRAVNFDEVAGFRGMTTFGWNCFEIVTGDLYAVSDTLQDSPWEIIGGPASLGGNFASIHAMQMIGPSQEVLYLTEQTDKESTLLPDPRGLVGRTFILVLGGPDVGAIMNFYGSKFSIPVGEPNEGTNALVNKALDLPEDYKLEIGFMPLGEPGNFLEIDGYPEMAGARPRTEGQLPPGNALSSFSVNNPVELDLEYISAPVQDDSLAYGGHRSATFIGPAGELTELIEEPRAPVAT